MLDCESSFESNGSGEPPIVRRMEVVSGLGGRRRWTREAKSPIIEEMLVLGASVAAVARRYGMFPQQLYAWRAAARAHQATDEVGFVPVALNDVTNDGSAGGSTIPVRSGDLSVYIPATASADHIDRVLRAARAVE